MILHHNSSASQATVHLAGGCPAADLGQYTTCRTAPVAGAAMLPSRACGLTHLDYSACQTGFHQSNLLQLLQIQERGHAGQTQKSTSQWRQETCRQDGMHPCGEQQI